MDALLFLEQVEKADTITRNLLIERKQWEDLAYSITAHMGGERVQTSGTQSKMADAIARCLDMEAAIDQKVAYLAGIKLEVTHTIEQLPTVYYDVLHRKYVQYQDYYDIADAYGKDYSWATTTHGRARHNLQRLLNEREQNAVHKKG